VIGSIVHFPMSFDGDVLNTAGIVLHVNIHNRGRDRSFVVEILGMAVTLHIWEDDCISQN